MICNFKPDKVYLRPQGSVPFGRYGFQRPMYQDPSEIVDLIKIAIQEASAKKLDSVRTLESGSVEEHAVIEKGDCCKKLIFRV